MRAPFILLGCLLTLPAAAYDPHEPGGYVEVEIDGAFHRLPALQTDMEAYLAGDLASVSLQQRFHNPGTETVHARYVFPLPENAAVHEMTLTTDDEVVRAEIKRKAEAVATFEEAKAEGKQAALLTQHRPNVFTQDIAHLPPGGELMVEITYAHEVPRKDGAYDFQFPMVVGPRYVPADRAHTGEPELLPMGEWTLGGTETTAAPGAIDPDRVSVLVHLDAGTPIKWVSSPSHSLDVQADGVDWRTVALDEGRTIDNKDFVLRYALADDEVAVSATAFAEEGRGIVSLVLEPPAELPPAEITPREMVFVLDTSCSMSGAPMDASKRFMRRALQHLRPTDAFRIVKFSSTSEEMRPGPIMATDANVAEAVRYVDGLYGNGGTEMTRGIRAALDPAPLPGTMRIVVFLTDGYIGNDVDVIRLVEDRAGEARLFSFGVGTSVNRWLLEEMARTGRGVARIVEDAEGAPAAADVLADRLDAPVLTDVTIDWGDAPVRDVTPELVPDLFLGESVRVMARFDEPGEYEVVVRGTLAGREATLPVAVTLPDNALRAEALPVIWARSRIEDRMIDYLSPLVAGAERDALQEEITVLGLEHGLVTQWTSFVAVAKRPVEVVGDPSRVAVATPVPQGTSGGGVVTWSGPSWGGSAAPEPVTWAAMLLMAAAGGAASRRRRSASADA